MGLFRKKAKPKHAEITEKELSQFQLRLYKTLATTSKQLIWFFAINGVLWIWCSYILAFIGKEQIAESLSSTVCQVIIGTCVAYLVTSTVENVSKYNPIFAKYRQIEPQPPKEEDEPDISAAPPEDEHGYNLKEVL